MFQLCCRTFGASAYRGFSAHQKSSEACDRMSRASDEIRTVQRLRTENQRLWRNLLIGLKKFLVLEKKKSQFDIHQFLGDGWILLFDPDSIAGPQLMRLLERLCEHYVRLFRNRISEVLSGDSYQIGLTFGIDSGTLVKIVMNQRDEYIGRSLNVAARLQSAITQKDKTPAGKLLISKNAFAALGLGKTPKYTGKLVERRLKNVAGGECYQVRKIIICKCIAS
jgi:hypothetical protein